MWTVVGGLYPVATEQHRIDATTTTWIRPGKPIRAGPLRRTNLWSSATHGAGGLRTITHRTTRATHGSADERAHSSAWTGVTIPVPDSGDSRLGLAVPVPGLRANLEPRANDGPDSGAWARARANTHVRSRSIGRVYRLGQCSDIQDSTANQHIHGDV
jgi:hypothetical protein